MMRACFRWPAVVVLVLAAGACAPPAPELRFVEEVAGALGGRDRIARLRTLAMEGGGTMYNLGQDVRPFAATQTFALSNYTRRLDLAGGRARVEWTRTPHFTYFQGPDPQRQVHGIDGENVYAVNAQGAATRASGQATVDRRIDALSHPLVLVRDALLGQAAVANVRAEGAGRQADITTRAGLTFTMAVDASGLPVRVEIATSHANLGDIVVRLAYGDYTDVSGVKLPTRITTSVDDFTTVELRLARQAIDSDVGSLAAPELPAPAPALQAPEVAVEPVAKGVWRLAGGSHHSVLVEFADRLVLVEAPQSEARTLAVIAKAREVVPGKPLAALVVTHHHFDHTGGLRAAIAEGLTIITHAGNRAFVEAMAARPHTRKPDRLQEMPRAVRVETVDGVREIKDAAMTMVLHHVAGNPHSETMLMAYLPGARAVVEVDAFSPGSAAHPYAANLLENIRALGLRADRIIPLHGAVVPFSALEAAAK